MNGHVAPIKVVGISTIANESKNCTTKNKPNKEENVLLRFKYKEGKILNNEIISKPQNPMPNSMNAKIFSGLLALSAQLENSQEPNANPNKKAAIIVLVA